MTYTAKCCTQGHRQFQSANSWYTVRKTWSQINKLVAVTKMTLPQLIKQ